MEYSDLRHRVQSGHLVFFKPTNLFAKLIARMTVGKVSHCGILVWIKDSREVPRLVVLEGHSGGCSNIENYAYGKTGKTAYSYFDFITIWLKELLVRSGLSRWSWLVPNTSGEVCSEVVADILDTGEIRVEKLLSPQKLFVFAQANAKSEVLEITG